MTTVKGESFSDLASLQEKMNRLFNDSLKKIKELGEPDRDKAWHPRVDMLELPAALVLLADVPGVPRESVSVEIQGETLIISGNRPIPEEMSQGSLYRSERHYGLFERKFNLPFNAEAETIQARIAEGVLRVTIAKPEEQITRVKVNIE